MGDLIRRSTALLFLVLCCNLTFAQKTAGPSGTPAKDCDDARIRYTATDPQYANRIEFADTKEARPPGSPKASPQHTRWIQVVAPDYTKQGPWTTNVWIGEGDDQTTLKLVLRNHEGFSLEWLNEKLLYGSVAWSKTLSTDFIYDVEAKKFVYREMESSAEMNEPCE